MRVFTVSLTESQHTSRTPCDITRFHIKQRLTVENFLKIAYYITNENSGSDSIKHNLFLIIIWIVTLDFRIQFVSCIVLYLV